MFRHFWAEYDKRRDTPRIIQHMVADEIPPEIKEITAKAVRLTGRAQ